MFGLLRSTLSFIVRGLPLLHSNCILFQESVVRSQCEFVISQMKEELLRYAENANRQALDYVEKAVSQSKESTAAKYKKYYQR